MTRRALIGAGIFDGARIHQGAALLLDDAEFVGIVPAADVPYGYITSDVGCGTLSPGFVDLQVNGGGGVMFNDAPEVETLKTIAAAHARTGTRALLPTLITDTPVKTQAAISAVAAAITEGVPGIAGIHLEGPHLSVTKKGAHDADLIRPMEDDDLALLADAAQTLPNVMVTVAPESVSTDQISRLAAAGVTVSLGHTDCHYDQAQAAFAAGARCVTHLFNAMSQMESRAPGLVGAALATSGVSAGLIADGIHVHPGSIAVALRAKEAADEVFLVTDAMATAGSEIADFTLNGRLVTRRDGRLTLGDGTLAGADLDFPRALSFLIGDLGVPLERALRMVTANPANCLHNPGNSGHFAKGNPANVIHISPDYATVTAV